MIETNIKFISNFNIDGIPYKNRERIKNNSREFNDLCLLNYIKNFNIEPEKHLFLSFFQEVWSSNNDFLLKYYSQRYINTLFDIFIIIIYFFMIPFLYLFTRDDEYILLDQTSGIFPFNYSIGTNITKNKYKIVDSGLVILSNWKPIISKFYEFKTKNSILNGEFIINRGILFTFFIDEKDVVTTLVFNVQLSITKKIQEKEIEEIIFRINNLRIRFDFTRYQEIILVGDFKSELNTKHMIKLQKELNLLPLSKKKEKTHMFYWRNDPFVNLNFVCSGNLNYKYSRFPWNSVVLKMY